MEKGSTFGRSAPKPRAPKVESGVLVKRPVSISKVEGTLQDADGVVVGLFTPAMAVCDGDETRITDL